ncbi:hypothetical protein ACOSP7_031243 [Xanthoceras sorbifolium]
MIMKRDIPEAFRGPESEGITTAKEFFAKIEKRFVKNDKVETTTLLASLISMKYKGKRNIREYIMEMSHIASKLKTLKLELSDDFLVHLVLISLPAQFSQFKVSYNCQKDKWTLNELILYCVQDEDRLKQEKIESAHFASTSKDKGKKRKKDHKAAKGPAQKNYLKHFNIWGFPAEARPYRPHEKKLDSKTVSSYFIGYSERSRGYKFYDPTLRSIFETGTTTFF